MFWPSISIFVMFLKAAISVYTTVKNRTKKKDHTLTANTEIRLKHLQKR